VAKVALKPGVPCARGVSTVGEGFSVVADVVACGFAGRSGSRIDREDLCLDAAAALEEAFGMITPIDPT
jgi:hypothetical protein